MHPRMISRHVFPVLQSAGGGPGIVTSAGEGGAETDGAAAGSTLGGIDTGAGPAGTGIVFTSGITMGQFPGTEEVGAVCG